MSGTAAAPSRLSEAASTARKAVAELDPLATGEPKLLPPIVPPAPPRPVR